MTENRTKGQEFSTEHVVSEIRGQVGCITLNRPGALNALSLPMIRAITRSLRDWQGNDQVKAVAFRGVSKDATSPTGNRPFGNFCAGGDIRFFHQAALAGNPELEDFFTEEYALNHLIHSYAKPSIAFLDGIVMGGGMGLAQGASLRLATEHTKMAMPETLIGLFPDVGGGYFLSRCPGYTGEWLALTGETLGGGDAVALHLADACVEASRLLPLWEALGTLEVLGKASLERLVAPYLVASHADLAGIRADIDHYFSMESVSDMVQALEHSNSPWASRTAATLRQRSPLMLHVTLAQIRRARGLPGSGGMGLAGGLSLAQDLRMERDLVHHCFDTAHLNRRGAASETVEGIRALAVDKDRQPRWNPQRIEDVTPTMVAPFFASPWPAHTHPLRDLA